jgi:hypothetical protein
MSNDKFRGVRRRLALVKTMIVYDGLPTGLEGRMPSNHPDLKHLERDGLARRTRRHIGWNKATATFFVATEQGRAAIAANAPPA